MPDMALVPAINASRKTTDPRSLEWLEADGLGGFASGTVSGIRTRRYHALLLVATTPPSGRMVLVDGFEAAIEAGGRREFLSRQHYAPDVTAPADAAELEAFIHEPWPAWTLRTPTGYLVEQELFVPAGLPAVALRWRLVGGTGGAVRTGATDSAAKPVQLVVRPFLSGRNFHAMHQENAVFDFGAEMGEGRVRWHPYEGVPAVTALANAEYAPEPLWYRRFVCTEELARGLDFVTDLAAPGVFTWDLAAGDAVLLFTTDPAALARDGESPADAFARLRAAEALRRARFATPLHRAADAYLVKRGAGKTIIAGYPWFGDWGRDTFVALRGLCLAAGRRDDARAILLEWAERVSGGMLPNRFADAGDAPEFNAVDAALWYVVAVHEYLQGDGWSPEPPVGVSDRERLEAACRAIIGGYASGTRHRIHMDVDGLLAAGEPGVQLTWMDAKVGDRVVTPRIGKPVEVQALWLNALRIVSDWDPAWREPYERGRKSFLERFWNEAAGCLYDIVDADHQPGAVDASLRPNQILAVGGLPFALLDGVRARRVVDVVERALWTPLGLRSLAADDPRYAVRYEGGVRERDGAYHQGTVWPWLLGPFVEAWLRVHGDTADTRRRARHCFLEPLLRHMGEAGLGHVSEIADAEPPHTPRGCPFQAWSVGEALRLDQVVLRRPRLSSACA
ncbi:MAG TPA: amylo-alpha-1,6-glucosidase [Gemmatimonadales bacterium]|nr:amylo-alpha-1,6-glucosidase [Gemmatimonadales bacterium]